MDYGDYRVETGMAGGTRKDGKRRQTAAVEVARQMYLYGQGDGKRIVNVPKLAELSGLTEHTIRVYLPQWSKEHEEILTQSSSTTLGLHLSAEVVSTHRDMMMRLESEMKQVAWEVENHDDVIASLGDLVQLFAGTDESEKALAIFDRYIRASCNKQSLRTQFLALQRQWVKLSGVESLMDVALTREKTLATGKAKQDLAAGDPNKKEETPPTRSGVFARRVTDTRDAVDES